MKLNISKELSLPHTFVTQTQAILAKRGVGKSYTASVQAEEMLKINQQIVVIDITGAWWGLRSSASGKEAGYPILVAGGEHGDIPLEKSSGELMASAITQEKFSCILDMTLFRKGEALTFLADFLSNLYRLNRTAIHLFLDEADFYAPQKPFGNEAVTLGATDDVVRRGRSRGIGCTLITQRPAVLNKNVLTQCEVLTTLRLVHPKDINAIKEWVDVHGDPKLADEMIESLPSLPVGTCWIWAPGWPDEKGIFSKVRIRQRNTFDSGATPKAGETLRQPKVLAQVKIEELSEAIKATAERAKENDPKALKAKIAELQRQLANQKPEIQIKEVVKYTNADEIVKSISKCLETYSTPKILATPYTTAKESIIGDNALTKRAIELSNGTHDSKLSKCEQAILNALGISYKPFSKNKVALLSGYRLSGSFHNALSSLRTKDLIHDINDNIALTSQGMCYSMSTGVVDLNYWKAHPSFGKCEKAILDVLEKKSPVSFDMLLTYTGYKNSGSFHNCLSNLRTAGVITGNAKEPISLSSDLV